MPKAKKVGRPKLPKMRLKGRSYLFVLRMKPSRQSRQRRSRIIRLFQSGLGAR